MPPARYHKPRNTLQRCTNTLLVATTNRAAIVASELILCLLVGVVLTVTVSWSIAAGWTLRFVWSEPSNREPGFIKEADRPLGFMSDDRRIGGRLQRWSSGNAQSVDEEVRRFDSGWPMYALYFGCDYSNGSGVGVLRLPRGWVLPHHGMHCPDAQGQWRMLLPAKPLPLGFLVNTVLGGASVWLLFFAPRSIRCSIRRRRGQCEKCGYSIHGVQSCPECGRPATQTR